MVVMLTSMVSVSVRPASCSCVERSLKALIFFVMSLSCAEGSHLLLELIQLFLRQFLNGTREALLERLRTRSLLYCLLDLLFQSIFWQP